MDGRASGTLKLLRITFECVQSFFSSTLSFLSCFNLRFRACEYTKIRTGQEADACDDFLFDTHAFNFTGIIEWGSSECGWHAPWSQLARSFRQSILHQSRKYIFALLAYFDNNPHKYAGQTSDELRV